MARPTKNGCDYYPMDTDFLDDRKIRLIQGVRGPRAIIVLLRQLGQIYRDEGFWMKWDEESQLLFATDYFPGTYKEGGGLCVEVTNEAIRRGFYNKDLFDRFSILTSYGIQRRYFEIKKKARLRIRGDFVISRELVPKGITLIGVNSEKTPIISEITPIIPETTVYKEKKSKEKYIYPENGVISEKTKPFPSGSDEIQNALDVDIIGALHKYWNTHASGKGNNLIPSKVLHDKTRNQIWEHLNVFSQHDIHGSILWYSRIIHNPKLFYYDHRWTFDEFFSTKKGNPAPFEKFLESAQPEINFRRKECQLT